MGIFSKAMLRSPAAPIMLQELDTATDKSMLLMMLMLMMLMLRVMLRMMLRVMLTVMLRAMLMEVMIMMNVE
jgi:hypothetical protein